MGLLGSRQRLVRILVEQGDLSAAEHLLDSDSFCDECELQAQDCCNFAQIYFRCGRDRDAAVWLDRAIELDASLSWAHRLYAWVYIRSGSPASALDSLDRALWLDPCDAEAHFLKAEALVALKRYHDAANAYEQALEHRPCFPEALCNYGCLLHLIGRHHDALPLLERAVVSRPEFPVALSALGIALKQCGEPDRAAAVLERAIDLDPSFPEAYLNLGQVLQAETHAQIDRAELLYCKALALRENNPEAINNLGTLYELRGQHLLARSLYEKALLLRPDYPQALANLGNTYAAVGDHEKARDFYLRSIELAGDVAEFRHNLGLSYQRQGRMLEAIRAYRGAVALSPDFIEPLWNKAFCHLYLGDYNEGWRDYECRLQSPVLRKLCFEPELPMWDGSQLSAGQTLILVGEQGLGDSLQFVRYARHLLDQGLDVAVCVPDALVDLFVASGLASRVLPPSRAGELREGVWLPILSLPGYLDVDASRPLVLPPYLVVDPNRLTRWRDQLRRDDRPVVAINWQGTPATEVSHLLGRSLPLELFRPLVESFDLSLVSVQKGPGSEQLNSCTFRHAFVDVQSEIDDIWDFQEIAAILASCDLVITSDTAVAHLAAAIGAPTWLLLHHIPDWRWGLDGDSSFWYPSMRLFRQQRQGDWAGVIDQVIEALPATLRQPIKKPPKRGIFAGFWRWLEDSVNDPQPEPVGNAAALPVTTGPDLQDVKRGLAVQCLRKGCLSEARRLFEELLESGREEPDVHAGLGAVLLSQQNDCEAIHYLELALAARPDHADTLCNLGTAHYRIGDIERALTAFQRALLVNPDHADSISNLAVLDQAFADIAAAAAGYRRAITLDPDHVRSHWHLAHCLFLQGDYPGGWIEHEWRLLDDPQRKLHAMPLAQRLEFCSNALDEIQSLLLVGEQGIGDTLQFIRYVPILTQRAGSITLCIPERLHALIAASLPGIPLLTPAEGNIWASGPWLSLMSVAGLLEESPEHPLIREPYLSADPESVERWSCNLSSADGPVVALNWQGNPSAEVGAFRGRSLTLEALGPLASVSGIRFLSLQKGFGSEQFADCSFRDQFVACQELVDDAWDFLETAAILANCDLVITSDTALAHLSGALGRPTWLLLHHVPDWRWGLEGDKSFWYPSMRLFRQAKPGDWAGVMSDVTEALRQWRDGLV